MCGEYYVDKNRIPPLLNSLDCLENHTLYIFGSCRRYICIGHDEKMGLQRWHFPFHSLEITKLCLRTADYTLKKTCGIYKIKNETGRICYKIFSSVQDFELFLKKNKKKTCENRTPLFMIEKYIKYANT